MEGAKRNQRDESPVFTLTQKRKSIFRVASRAGFVQIVGSDPICTLRLFVLRRYLALPLFDRSLFAPLEQPRRLHPLRPRRERWSGTAPAKRLDLPKEWRIGAQRR